MLVPTLMTWVHMLRYDAMIEGSLLLMGIVVVLAVGVVILTWLGRRIPKSAAIVIATLSSGLIVNGCVDSKNPDDIWCKPGSAAELIYPRGITYSSTDDTFFVVDRTARIRHIDRSGRALSQWRMPESAQGKPVGLTVGPEGNVYVPDTHYHRVIVYKPDGTEIRRWGSFGTDPGEFIYPTDIAFDAKGNIFVSEYGDHDRVQVFDTTGTFLYQFGHFGQGDGEFSRPQSMVIDGDLVYLTDACNHRIVVFKTDGTWVRNMCTVGSDLGQLRFPYGLDMDVDGNLIVCEFGNNRVQQIDKTTGKGLAAWGGAGHAPGQLAYPWAVAVDRKDRIIAVDAGNNRLQVFEF
jgi:DNA-binding beta-propeller fold protein YncE